MPRHTSAFYQSTALGSLSTINAVPDTQIFSSGANLRVDPTVDMLGSVYSVYLGTTFTQTQIVTPSLRQLAPFDVSENNLTVATTVAPSLLDIYGTPKQLVGNETLTFSQNGAHSGAVAAYGVVDFVDAPIKPVTGNIFTIRATGAAALSAGVYVNTALTLDTVLPAGNYQVVGFRAEGANLIASRIAFVGQVYRPGCPGSPLPGTPDYYQYRAGNLGVWGTFNINQPPTTDCLGITDTTQVFYLDLIQTTQAVTS